MPHLNRPLATLAAIVVLVGCEATSSGTPPASSGGSAAASLSAPASASAAASPSVAPTTLPPAVALADLEHIELDLAGGPDWPTFLDGSVWILAPDGPLGAGGQGALIYRLDAATGRQQDRIPLGGRLCQGIEAGFGSLWACTDRGLVRIDAATNGVSARARFTTAQVFARPVITEDRVWMLAGNVFADQLVEIDPATNEVVATHPLDHTAAGLTAADGALYATVPAEGLVLRIDPASGEVTVHAEGLPGPWTIAHGAGSLWVGLYAEQGGDIAAAGEPTVARLSPADGSVEAEISTGTTTMFEGDIWAGDDAVWVRNPADPFLVRIDPTTNQVVAAIGGFHAGGSLTVVDGIIWTTSIQFGTAWRITP